MADAAIEQENEEVLDDQVQEEQGGDVEQEEEQSSDKETPENPEETDEVVVHIGDTPVNEEDGKAPQWVKDLRRQKREDTKRIRELEEKLAATQKADKPVLGKKPALADADIDFDPVKFEAALEDWHEKKRTLDRQEEQERAQQQQQQQAWQQKLARYGDEKIKLKVPDYQEAEEAAYTTLSTIQQGIIVQGADNPALVVYALGKNPAKLKELADITDPVNFAVAIGKLETQLKVTKRTAPAPEKVIKGAAPNTSAVNNQLDKLREEAEKTGDFSKVMEYKRNHRK